jgi:protein AbiQ
MARLKFYEVDEAYISFLTNIDNRVPRVNYSVEGRRRKFLCGIVLEVSGHAYFAPVSSFNKQLRSNFIIEDAHGNSVGSLRFSYMIPIPLDTVRLKDFSIEDPKYRNLLDIELRYINRNVGAILTRARYVYNSVVVKKDPAMVKNCCDFKALEAACAEYTKQQSPKMTTDASKPSMDDRMAAAVAEAGRRNEDLPKREDEPPRGG